MSRSPWVECTSSEVAATHTVYTVFSGQDGGDATEEKDFRQDWREYAGVRWASVGQAVMQLGVFFGVKKLVTLPVPQLQDSGFWLMPDLMVAGPYFIMPLMVAPLANLQLMVSVTMPDAQFD